MSESRASQRRKDIDRALQDLSTTPDPRKILYMHSEDNRLMMMKTANNGIGYEYIYYNTSLVHHINDIYLKNDIDKNRKIFEIILLGDRAMLGTLFEVLYIPLLYRDGLLNKLLGAARPLGEDVPSMVLPSFPDTVAGNKLATDPSPITLEDNTLYSSDNKSFPVFDGFIVHKSDKDRHFIRLQFTVAKEHHTSVTAVGEFCQVFDTVFGREAWDT
eukprot:Tbor_TRINITY_DN6210_c1_g2::TRINITY_DN6210_c1_g2_i6::g.1870::m.1870